MIRFTTEQIAKALAFIYLGKNEQVEDATHNEIRQFIKELKEEKISK